MCERWSEAAGDDRAEPVAVRREVVRYAWMDEAAGDPFEAERPSRFTI